MASNNGLQIKIPELDPYGVELVEDSEGKLHPEWSECEEHPSEAGLVPVSVPDGNNGRYTAKVPLPVPGEGLVSEDNGVFGIDYDPHTMEITPDGKLAARTSTCDGVTFTSGTFTLNDDWHKFEFSATEPDVWRSSTAIIVHPDKYPVNKATELPEGDIVIPGDIKWMKVDALLSFTAPAADSSVWAYDLAFVVRELYMDGNGSFRVDITHEFPFRLDTTEPLTVVSCPISLYNDTNAPKVIDTGLKWTRGDDPVLGISCIGKVTLTAS